MPRRAKITSTGIMWAAILASGLLISQLWITVALVAAGSFGTWSIWMLGRRGNVEKQAVLREI